MTRTLTCMLGSGRFVLCCGLTIVSLAVSLPGTVWAQSGASTPEEETTAPGNYTGVRADYLAYDVYPYGSFYSDRYIRYGAANQGRRAVYDRLGQFVSYGSYGLQWTETRDRYTQQKLDAGDRKSVV